MDLLLILSIILLNLNIIKFPRILKVNLGIWPSNVLYVAILTFLYLDLLKLWMVDRRLFCSCVGCHVLVMKNVMSSNGVPKLGNH